MRIFVYEHLTGGGLLAEARATDRLQPLAAEGRAMCAALADDFSRIEGAQVIGLRDAIHATWHSGRGRLIDVASVVERDDAFDQAAAEADWTVIIAPETGGALAEGCRRVNTVGGRLLGGPSRLVELAGDKQATAEQLLLAGVPAPYGIPFTLGQPWPADFCYPAIWKPRDGAGSQGLQFIEHRHAPVPQVEGRPGRLEEFCPRPQSSHHAPPLGAQRAGHTKGGTTASVAFLCGPAGKTALPPCAQHLDSKFRYLGGSLPLAPPLAHRAARLASQAVEALPEPLGYIGVDVVLGRRDDGREDVAIEINPRLTTSYLGLRAACRQNLAAAMLAVAAGEACALSFCDRPITFSAAGEIQR